MAKPLLQHLPQVLSGGRCQVATHDQPAHCPVSLGTQNGNNDSGKEDGTKQNFNTDRVGKVAEPRFRTQPFSVSV
ncbi:MAG: hypothetical protein CL911_01530 [Deltaproteobacteria bacterium]|nr:hypothetical protein [Deltaproteobacteria bacterium]